MDVGQLQRHLHSVARTLRVFLIFNFLDSLDTWLCVGYILRHVWSRRIWFNVVALPSIVHGWPSSILLFVAGIVRVLNKLFFLIIIILCLLINKGVFGMDGERSLSFDYFVYVASVCWCIWCVVCRNLICLFISINVFSFDDRIDINCSQWTLVGYLRNRHYCVWFFCFIFQFVSFL